MQSNQSLTRSLRSSVHHLSSRRTTDRRSSPKASAICNLSKVARTAKINGTNREVELRSFLRAYRDTPHSTIGVAPALLLLGYSRTSGLPSSGPSREQLDQLHQHARMHTKSHGFSVGDMVLHKLKQVNKLTSSWDPAPYVVMQVKGGMITASRQGHQLTRNSSQFKLSTASLDDEYIIAMDGEGAEQPLDLRGQDQEFVANCTRSLLSIPTYRPVLLIDQGRSMVSLFRTSLLLLILIA